MPVPTMIHTQASRPQGIDLSLHRVTELLQRLSNPQAKFPIIHVAGTNSKGSTIAYLSSILNDSFGILTASFTSPHLKFERDCCKIGSQSIEEAIWQQAGERVRDADSPSSASSLATLNSSSFELLTARCFTAFDLLSPANRPEVLLIEVGMGGALDATNVFSPSQVLASVICPIDYDHQSFLGNTLREIAHQKAGIVKQRGLCILADQRRPGTDTLADDQVDCTRVRATDAQRQIEGREVAEIQEAVRQTCAAMHARLVKAYVPWQDLSGDFSGQADIEAPWSATISTHARYTPVLMPSTIHEGDYTSSTGDPVVPGPTLRLSRTRAAMTGCHLALQTLWSIARDETPCSLGQPGADVNEELRLRIAFALRDDRFAKQNLETIIEQTRISGRAEWIDLQLPGEESEAMQVEDDSSTRPSLHVLVDGAHNSSAASALRQYVQACVQNRVRLSKQQQPATSISHVTITWIIAFSQGKDIVEIIQNLLGDEYEGMDKVTNDLAASLLDLHVEHKVACLPFTTPVEGMPWVASVPTDQVATAFATHAPSTIQVQTFDQLQQALTWAATNGDGKTVTEGKTNMVVIAGSLYLVSDVHRLISN